MLSPQPGTEIDGFRLGERMHVGTMAWIYRLMGPDGPLPLIMKMPRVGPTERPANIISFEVERMVLGALAQSPHHPTLVAYGDVETTPYLVMEQVEGRRLQEWIERAPIAAEETARLGHAFAMALHEVHRQDVIHLDLKSTNVLYRASGAATLIDFGLSSHRHYPDLLAEELRFPVGNWSYMSPEQVLGVRCDPRSCAAGCIGTRCRPAPSCLRRPTGCRRSSCIAWKSTAAIATPRRRRSRSTWRTRRRWRSRSAATGGAGRG